jgi:hypothetical protein
MELEAVVGAVVELGEKLGVPMPTTRTVYACAKMLDAKQQRRPRGAERGMGALASDELGGVQGSPPSRKEARR